MRDLFSAATPGIGMQPLRTNQDIDVDNPVRKHALLDDIRFGLSIFTTYAKFGNLQGKGDFNKVLEDILCPVLSIAHQCELENLNYVMQNYPAIDLGDKEKRVCYQITTSNSRQKLSKTIKAFRRHNLKQDYDNLTVFFVTDYNCPQMTREYDGFKVKTMNVCDLLRPLQHINSQESLFAIRDKISVPLQNLGLLAIADSRQDIAREELKHAKKFLSFFQALHRAILDRPLQGRSMKLSLREAINTMPAEITMHWLTSHPNWTFCRAFNLRQQHLRRLALDLRVDMRKNNWGSPTERIIGHSLFAPPDEYFRPYEKELSDESRLALQAIEERLSRFINAYNEFQRFVMTLNWTPRGYYESLI